MGTYKLNYRGFEVWLKHYKGECLQFSTQPQIDEDSQTISASIQLEPKTPFVLFWRRKASYSPVSALCQVFLKNGCFKLDNDDVCAASLVMDKTRRRTQDSRTTYGNLNAPYKRKGSMKAGRMCDYPVKTLENLELNAPDSSSSVRLEIRRIRGEVIAPEWVTDPDMQEFKRSNADQMDIIDDEQKNMLPFATFIFEFPIPSDNRANIPLTISSAAETIHSKPSRSATKAHVMILRRTQKKGPKHTSSSVHNVSSDEPYPTPSSPIIIEIDSDEEG
ncbi:hypothetical protein CVT25_008349 [Psilocybe cyanescens]|uniref:Uncharacterized protein n=1 Tax=Psilocybe cyanescens TaxID=93625 RepID=A0A409WV41_PSICY|nr:hypothetical protein CVT25_008349 [Psilocybe cyanescens]